MPRLIDLVTPAEVRLLGLVPALPVPLDQFLAAEFSSRRAVDRVLYQLFTTIPGVEVGPISGDYTWVSPYTNYPAWLAWFLARSGRPTRRSVDPDLASALEAERMSRAGSDRALLQVATNPAWLHREIGSNARAAAAGKAPRQRRIRRDAEIELREQEEIEQQRGAKGVVEEFQAVRRAIRRGPPPRGSGSRNPMERFR